MYLASPVSLAHGSYDALFVHWISRYCFGVGHGLRATTNTTLFLGDSTYSRIIALFRPTGNERTGREYLEQLPMLVIEISHSSKSYDLGPKMAAYQSAGLCDYITVLLEEQRVEWRVLSGSRYRLLEPQPDQILRSPSVPGFWLDTTALFPVDEKRLFAAVDHGLSS